MKVSKSLSWGLTRLLRASSSLFLLGVVLRIVSHTPTCDAKIELDFPTAIEPMNGPANLEEARRYFDDQQYDEAAFHFWRAVLAQAQFKSTYSVEECFNPFLQCFALQGKLVDGFVFIAQESIGRGQLDMGKMYLNQALTQDPEHEEALVLRDTLETMGMDLGEMTAGPGQSTGNQRTTKMTQEAPATNTMEGTPEELYETGSRHFSDRNYEDCADTFEVSCQKSGGRVGPSCANAVYCRNMIIDWGFNGTQFDKDMTRIVALAERETKEFRREGPNGTFAWTRAGSPHPHMMLGYPVDSMLKRYMAESAAFMEDMMSRVDPVTHTLKDLPSDLPYDPEKGREKYIEGMNDPGFRIKVGFVSSGFNSKAVLYLSHDMFRFFDKSRFELNIFSLGEPDNPMFIRHGMRGVDWRERVKKNVDHFHDIRHLKNDHIGMARFIHDKGVHILIEWDGYARQGERAQGLFSLRSAPIQMWHQEYLGTSGAQYVDYLFSDKVTSPEHLQHLYTEKLIYLPNHFFSKGHAVQKEVKAPTYDYPVPFKFPYEVGSGNPQANRCLAPMPKGPKKPSVVFCNFNKFLKANPVTIRSWVRILREVPNSMLCLLENPPTGVVYLRRFIHETTGYSNGNADEDSFDGGDGDDINDRVHFLPWEKNPFDHQMRSQDFCNIMLDSHPYNGHTTAQDSLYGGVPIVTRSDGDDMSSRVTTSANIVLGLEELNAYDGPRQYEDIAIDLGNNPEKLKKIRTKLIDTALQRNPMHPYWDVARYVKNFQEGLQKAWDRYAVGLPPEHITVEETEEAKLGTYDEELLANPPDGKKKKTSDEL